MELVIEKVRQLGNPNSGFYRKKLTKEQNRKIDLLDKLIKVDVDSVTQKLLNEAFKMIGLAKTQASQSRSRFFIVRNVTNMYRKE